TQVLALSVSTNTEYVREMIAAGASGYVLKARAHKELLFALSAVAAGNVYLSPSITTDLLALSSGGG
ncbi:MAG: response regulator transcription factor, partial [Gammaproteobacteria bacterium]|nr:response regulator transcription factor [Gammaproteobacteria bacterium]